jgi:hypothetical protein
MLLNRDADNKLDTFGGGKLDFVNETVAVSGILLYHALLEDSVVEDTLLEDLLEDMVAEDTLLEDLVDEALLDNRVDEDTLAVFDTREMEASRVSPLSSRPSINKFLHRSIYK